MSRRGWLLFLTMSFIWGLPYLMIKVAVDELSPAALIFVRTTVAALLLVPLAAARGQLRPLLPRWKPLLVFAAVELAIPWLALTSAEQKLSSSLAGLLVAAVPLVGAVLGWLTGTDRLGPRRLVGLLVGLGGVAALVGLDLHGGIVPLLEMAVVAIGYALGPFILSRHLADLPGLGVIAAALGVTALGYLPVGVAQLPHHWPSARALAAIAGLAVVCTAVAFLVFFKLIDEVGPMRATVITYLNPAVAVALGVLLLDEPLTPGIGVGFALVLAGSVLATQRARPSQPESHTPPISATIAPPPALAPPPTVSLPPAVAPALGLVAETEPHQVRGAPNQRDSCAIKPA